MNFSKLARCAGLFCFTLLMSVALLAQTNCEAGAGPLNSAQPQGLTTQEIIEKFAAREELFKQARNNYIYTQDITVQELDGTTVTGEFRLVQDITYDTKMAFIITTSDVPHYNLLYVGQQHVDEIDTYVFDMAPKIIEKGQRYFQGRIWVDSKDMQVVKSCGKTVPEVVATKKKRNADENLSPKFVTYREQIDGQYWFPTYTMADDTLHFRSGDIHMREVIKYINYKRFGSKTKIIFKGEVKDESNPPPKKP